MGSTTCETGVFLASKVLNVGFEVDDMAECERVIRGPIEAGAGLGMAVSDVIVGPRGSGNSAESWICPLVQSASQIRKLYFDEALNDPDSEKDEGEVANWEVALRG